MRKRNLKTYEEYAVDYELAKDLAQPQVSQNQINNANEKYYEKLFVDYLLMKDVVDDSTNENLNDVIVAINKGDFEKEPQKFYDSFNKSKRIEFLTPYTVDDMRDFDCYKLRGYNIGFAIKNNGDIILVHNNESIKGIGQILMNKAIDFGGDHLDHFDGFLTGFYKSCGFKFKDNDIFLEEYKPKNWKYEKIDIYNPDKSIYAGELKVPEIKFLEANDRYDEGKPDVVYRKIKT